VCFLRGLVFLIGARALEGSERKGKVYVQLTSLCHLGTDQKFVKQPHAFLHQTSCILHVGFNVPFSPSSLHFGETLKLPLTLTE
jgi:hypothetical protein